MTTVKVSKRVLGKIEGILTGINPEVDFDTFHDIMDLVYIETYGSKHGLFLLDAWYSKCSEYSGIDSLIGMWNMYKDDDMRHSMWELMRYVKADEKEVEPVAPASKKQKSKK